MLILYVNYWLALEGHSFYDTTWYLCVKAEASKAQSREWEGWDRV